MQKSSAKILNMKIQLASILLLFGIGLISSAAAQSYPFKDSKLKTEVRIEIDL